MHPHGVKYNPEYDGVFLGDFTRAGGFVRARPRVHLHVGGDAGRRRRVALPRPRPQPHAEHLPRALRRAHRARARREAARRRGRDLLPLAGAAGHRPRAPVPVHQRPRLRRQHADAAGQGRPGRRHPRDGDGLQLPRLPHPRAPLEGRRRQRSSTPPPWGPTRRSPPASSRTTRAAGCTTATSSPTRTAGWRAGTWSSPKAPQEETFACRSARITIGLALAAALALAGRRAGGPLPAAVQPVDDAEGAEGPVPHAHGLQARLQVLRRSSRPSTRRRPATRSRSRAAPTARA